MILASLRTETASLHERVEHAVALPARLRSDASYAELLTRFYGLCAPLEEEIRRAAAEETIASELVGLDLASRRRASRIVDDLRVLGWNDEAVAVIPRLEELPPSNNAASVYGCLYVLEGSTLGGQVISHEVELRLGLTSQHGCSFFAGYGEQTRPMWTSFCRELTAFADGNPTAHDDIVAAAVETFACFETWAAEGLRC